MEDVQNRTPEVPLDIDRVGVRGLRLPLRVRDRAGGSQATVASADLGVDLPSARKGTHMSRLVQALDDWDEGWIASPCCACLRACASGWMRGARGRASVFPISSAKTRPRAATPRRLPMTAA